MSLLTRALARRLDDLGQGRARVQLDYGAEPDEVLLTLSHGARRRDLDRIDAALEYSVER